MSSDLNSGHHSASADLHAALTRGRRAVEQYIDELRSQGSDRWPEEHATERLYMAAFPHVKWINFNRVQERATGSDWLWWWVDPTGECFGLLIQAKILKRRPNGSWFIDFRYRDGSQMKNLLETANFFEVPAAYILYCGDVSYREGLNCGSRHVNERCGRCERASVSIVPGLIADRVVANSLSNYPGTSAVDAFHRSDPVEDLVDPDLPQMPLFDLNLRWVGADLRSFLLGRQTGVRQVARLIFAAVSRMRKGDYRAETSERIDVGTNNAVFREVPSDYGHFGAAYFHHILRGLRTELPVYVQETVSFGEPPAWLANRLAGIAIIDMH
jgi:hypothetical protein